MNKIDEALKFAVERHSGKTRKNSILPYSFHVIDVFNLLWSWRVRDVDVLCAALLHDVVEDTPCLPYEIEDRFGKKVMELVMELTFIPGLMTKQEYIDSFSAKSYNACLIKLADRICNVTDFHMAGDDYSVKYYQKAILLPEYLTIAAYRDDVDTDNNITYSVANYDWEELWDKIRDTRY